MSLLFLLIILPAISAGLVYALPKSQQQLVMQVGLVTSLVELTLGLLLWLGFDASFLGMQWFSRLLWVPVVDMAVYIGIDGLSLYFVLLTVFLVPVCILVGWDTAKQAAREYVSAFLFLESLVLLSFCTLDIFLFYVFFESILIPMFLIIGIFGSRERKVLAAYKFFFYTLLGSVIMLFSIIVLLVLYGTTNLEYLYSVDISSPLQIAFFSCFFASFATKIPMLPVHLWLPEAHVEAPTGGSVILAGVLLKLGGYGLMRFSIPLFPLAADYLSPVIYTLAILSILYASITTIRQVDLKKAVAYSSIAHMNMTLLGIFGGELEGLDGSIFLMISHGFISSALFLCVGMLYDRHRTRILPYYGGLSIGMPLYAACFVFLSLSNMGVPGTSGFIGELLILLSLSQVSPIACLITSLSTILAAVYSMWLCNRLLFGKVSSLTTLPFSDISGRELALLSPFVLLILLTGICPGLIMGDLQVYSGSLYQLYAGAT